MSLFQRATRKRAYLKMAVTGPSGAGKTYSALRLAFGLVPNGRIALLDTENRSAELYAGMNGRDGIGEFFVCPLAAPFSPERYIEVINTAAAEGFDVLIIDSMTHEWSGVGGILDEKGKLDTRGGNTWANWNAMTPRHNRFKDALLQSPIHVIATIRSKQDWVVDSAAGASNKPKKVGLAPEQRDGTEYEFTVVFDVAMDHNAMASKDRTNLFPNFNEVLTPATGNRLREWLESGAEPDTNYADAVVTGRVTEVPPESSGDAAVAERAAIHDGSPAAILAGYITEAGKHKVGKQYRDELAKVCGRKSLGILTDLPASVTYEGQDLPLIEAAAKLLATVTGDVFAAES